MLHGGTLVNFSAAAFTNFQQRDRIYEGKIGLSKGASLSRRIGMKTTKHRVVGAIGAIMR